MKKLLYIIAGISLASVTGLSAGVLGDEKADPEMVGNTWLQMAEQKIETAPETPAPAKDYNTTRSNTSEVSNGDPIEADPIETGVTIDVSGCFGTAISGGGSEDPEPPVIQGSGDPLKGLNVAATEKGKGKNC